MYRIRCTHKEETKEERCYSEKGLQCTESGVHTKKRQRKKDVTLTRVWRQRKLEHIIRMLRKGPPIKVRRLLVRTASAWCRYSLVHND